MVKQDRIAFAMGPVQKPAEAVGHGMHRSEAGVGKSQAGLKACLHEFSAQFQVGRVGDGAQEIGADQADGLQGMEVQQRGMSGGDKGLKACTMASMPVQAVR